MDAQNIIQTYLDDDDAETSAEKAAAIAALYVETDRADELIAALAHTAAVMARMLPGGVEFLTKRREHLLNTQGE